MSPNQKRTAPLLGAAVVLAAACGGGGGGGTTEEPIPQEILLTISGKIVGPAPSGAEVTARIGDVEVTTEAAEDGAYSLELAVDEALSSALVTLAGKFTGDQAFVEMLSQLGSVSDLQAQAGEDDSLSPDENIRTNISSLSTAEAVLLDEAAGGGGKGAIGNGIDAAEALELAAILELAATDPDAFALPQGTDTTLALARSRDGRASFAAAVEETDPKSLENARRALIVNPDVVGAITASDVPNVLLSAVLQVGGEFPFNFFDLVTGIEFDEEGRGRFFSSRTNRGISWTFADNRVRVTYDEPQLTFGDELVDCDGDGTPTREQGVVTDDGFELVILSPTAISLSITGTLAFPECPAVPEETVTSTGALTVLNQSNTGGFVEADIAGASFVAPVRIPNGETDSGASLFQAELLNFSANGTGSGTYLIDAFDWTIEDGTLTLTYADGVDVRYRTVASIDAVAAGVLVDSGAGIDRLAEIDFGFEADPAASIDPLDVAGQYFQFGVGEENGGDPRLKGFRFVLEPDGSGSQTFDFVDENGEVVDSALPLRWVAEGGELLITRYQDGDSGAPCDPPATGCQLVDERRLVAVNEDGERFYLLEFRQRYAGGVVNGPATTVARFYDRVPLAAKNGFVLSAPALRTPAPGAQQHLH